MGAVGEAEERRPAVLGLDVDGFGGVGRLHLGREGLDFTERALAGGVHGLEVGLHGGDGEAGDELDEVEPVGADVGDSAQFAAFAAEDAPVVVGWVEEPVLHVAAGDGVDAAQRAAPDHGPDFPIERVEAHVVVDAGGQPALARQLDERAGFGRGHRERLFAVDVFAGLESLACLLEVMAIGGGDVDGLDFAVGQQLGKTAVGFGDAQVGGGTAGFLGGGAEDAGHVDTQAAQAFGVGGAHETGSDDGYLGDAHSFTSWYWFANRIQLLAAGHCTHALRVRPA